MKKMLSLILAVCMLTLLFGACAKTEAPATAATEAPAAATEAPAAAPEAPAEPAAPEAPAAPAEDTVLAFMVKNKAKSADGAESLELVELYLYPKDSEEKYDNILGDIPQINSSEYQDYLRVVCVRPAAEQYEAYAVFSNGETGTYKNLEMMSKNSLSFKAADEVSCKADEDVVFTDEIKTDALADGSRTKAMATVAVELKNKTDVAIAAIYVYPVGAADKGSNILAGEFKSSGEHADYLHPVFLRDRVLEYEVYVEFADGTTAPMTITGLQLDNAITLSLKDTVGVEFSCDVIGTEDVAEDDLQEYYAIFTEDYVKPLQNEAKACH